MTVPTTARRAGPFNGNGVATSFPFTFKVFTSADVQVVKTSTANVDTTLALNTDYSVTLNPDQDATPGGTITYPVSGSPLALGEKLSVVGATDYDQQLDLSGGGKFDPVVIENALDRQEFQIQQLVEKTDRALTVSVATDTAVDTALPVPESNTLIGWNAAGDGLQNVGAGTLATIVAFGTAVPDIFTGDGVTSAFTLTDNPGALGNLDVAVGGVTQLPGVDYFWASGTALTFAVAPANGVKILVRYIRGLPQGYTDSAASTFTPAAAGALSRTVRDRLLDVVTTADYGSLAEAVAAAAGKTLFVLNGDHTYADEIAVPANTRIVGESLAAVIKPVTGAGNLPAKVGRNVTSCPAFYVATNNVTIEGLTIDGGVGVATGSDNEGGGIYVDGCDGFTMTGCVVKNHREYFLAIGPGAQCKRVTVRDNDFIADRNTLKASHYANMVVPTYVQECDISHNTFIIDSAIAAPTSVIGLINCENWGVGTSEWDGLVIANNKLRNLKASALNGIQIYNGTCKSASITGNQLYNAAIRAHATVYDLGVNNNSVRDLAADVDAAIKIDECTGDSSISATINVHGNRVRTCAKGGIFIYNNTATASGNALSVVGNNIQDFGTSSAATRYGIELTSVDTDVGTVANNIISTDTSRAHCVGLRLYSTDYVDVKQNRVASYTGMSFENTCDGLDVKGNKLTSTVQVSNYSLINSEMDQFFEFIWSSPSSTSAETVFSPPSKSNGFLFVTTSDDANNTNKVYSGQILFSRAGTAATYITEGTEVSASALAWSVSGAAIQATRSSTAVTDRVYVRASITFG